MPVPRSFLITFLAAVVGTIGGLCTPASPTWRVDNDFRIAPRHANPAPDRSGNPAVWHYLAGPVGGDPTTFKPLAHFTSRKWGIRGLESWTGTVTSGQDNLPAVGVNARDRDVYIPPGVGWPAGALLVHPSATEAVVVGWRNPVAGRFRVHTDVTLAQAPNCGNGIAWSLRQGSERLAEGQIEYGQSGSAMLHRRVPKGGMIFLVIDANDGNELCDSTLVEFEVSRVGPFRR